MNGSIGPSRLHSSVRRPTTGLAIDQDLGNDDPQRGHRHQGGSMRSLCRRLVAALAVVAGVAGVSVPATAGPVTIGYELVALGGSTYEYRYTVTNVSLATPVSLFSIEFDTALYDETSLTSKSSGIAGWVESFSATPQPPGLPAVYDVYNLSDPLDIGESATGFAVEFVWLGTGTPGSQPFKIYDIANFDVLDSGSTTLAGSPPNPMPEPSAALLTALALLGAAAATRQRSGCEGAELRTT
ncbi:MAG: hypothetical protein JNL87_08595 [Burkholderiaceae bacterium]|nr:hypothetical protein [Burkholderiaceae bacterium]